MRKLKGLGYTISSNVVACWEHGDPTARKRLIIIATRDDVFKANNIAWEWPDPVCDESWYSTARDVAIPDKEVPIEYLRYDRPYTYPNPKQPAAGRIQHIGYAGDPSKPRSAGWSDKPNDVHGWDGAWATQMGTNGGSRRPLLSWTADQPIGTTRMTVPVESCRIASLNEDSYLKFAREHYSRKDLGMSFDQWVRELVNLGVPLCTGVAIDKQVSATLQRAGVKPTDRRCIATSCRPMLALDDCMKEDVDDGLTYPMCEELIGRANNAHHRASLRADIGDCHRASLRVDIGDSGASDNLIDASLNDCIREPKQSMIRYATAGSGQIVGDVTGLMDVSVLNLNHKPNCPPWVDHTRHVTSIKGLGPGLWSLEAEYRDQGYDIHRWLS